MKTTTRVVFAGVFFSLHSNARGYTRHPVRFTSRPFYSSHCVSIVSLHSKSYTYSSSSESPLGLEVLQILLPVNKGLLIPRPLIPRAAVRARPLLHLEVPTGRRTRTRPLVPRAAVRVRPLQHLEMPATRRVLTRLLVPRAAGRARPLQHFEVPALRRARTCLLVPRATVRACPLQHLEIPAIRRQRARPTVPRPAVRSSPLPRKGILDATGDLAIACASVCYEIRAWPLRNRTPDSSPHAPSPPRRSAWRDSPRAAAREEGDLAAPQISEREWRRGGRGGPG